MRRLQILSDEQLKKLNTKRLLNVLNSARAVENAEKRSRMMSGVCCEMCMEWILDDEAWQERVVKPIAHLTEYKNRIKAILKTREHVS